MVNETFISIVNRRGDVIYTDRQTEIIGSKLDWFIQVYSREESSH